MKVGLAGSKDMNAIWTEPIAHAFAEVELHQPVFSKIVRALETKGQVGSWIGSGLNSNLKGLFFGSVAAEKLYEAIERRISNKQFNTYEAHNLIHVFANDAIFSAYNARRIFYAQEAKSAVGQQKTERIVGFFDSRIPRIESAASALRHSHDRMFGRNKLEKKVEMDRGQMVRHFGSTLELTDENLERFIFVFSPQKVTSLLEMIASELERE
jgi:hypothetical protein